MIADCTYDKETGRMRNELSVRNVSEALLRWRMAESVPNRQSELIGNVDDVASDGVAPIVNMAIADCAHRNGAITLAREEFDGMHRFVLRDTRDVTSGLEVPGAPQIIHATKSAEGMAVVLLCAVLDDNDDVLTTTSSAQGRMELVLCPDCGDPKRQGRCQMDLSP